MQVGILASTIANFSMCRPKEPLTAQDYMPSRKKEKEKTDEEIAIELAQQLSFFATRPDVPSLQRAN